MLYPISIVVWGRLRGEEGSGLTTVTDAVKS
jgi:hypothetical protein